MGVIKEKLAESAASLCGSSLKARCARSGIILGCGVFVAKVLGFGSKVVLARLLVPQDIGLMVMILCLTQLFEVLTEIGIKQSVIQHKSGGDDEYLNMAWWFQSVRATGLYAVAFIITPWLCEFYFRGKAEVLVRYSMEELVTMIRVAFLGIFFNGFVSPKSYVLEKKFRFGRVVVITQGGFVLGAIVTVILACVMRNVWAIVIGFVSIWLTKCMMSYVLCPFVPKFAYHRESFQGLYRFARGMLGLPVLTYIVFNVDVLVAGKLVSTSLVGFYGMALTLAFVPWVFFSGVINPILLPAFAEKQDDREALCKAVVQISRYIALFTIPPMVLAIVCSSTILTLVYGAQFSVVAVPLGILCVYVVLLIQGGVFASVFFGIGQPGKHRLFTGFRAFILIALIYPAIKFFGLTGAASVIVLASFAAMCLQLAVIHKMIGLHIFDYVVSWLPGLLLAIPVSVIIVIVRGLQPGYPKVHLAIGVLSCVVVCLTGLFLFRHFDKTGWNLPRSVVPAKLANRGDIEHG